MLYNKTSHFTVDAALNNSNQNGRRCTTPAQQTTMSWTGSTSAKCAEGYIIMKHILILNGLWLFFAIVKCLSIFEFP